MVSTPIKSQVTNIPDYIDAHHWEEWKKSCVSDEIIGLNVRSIHDGRELDRILNCNNKRRWKHSDELVPAWCVSGLDPLTDESTLQGVQVKPDTPRINEEGKPVKYESAREYENAPLFLNTGEAGYWVRVFEDILVPIIITEGAKKAAAILSAALAAISIPGVSTCRKKGRLHQNLELFARFGRTFYLCFDNDTLLKKPVQDALIGLARELTAKGSKVMVIVIPDGEAKGADDYIALHGEQAFKELVEKALTIEEWKEQIQQDNELLEKKYKSRTAERFHLVNKIWGEHLRYNTLKKDIELYGAALDMNHIKLILALEFDVDLSKDDAFNIIERIAKANSYSPVVEYLNEVEAKHMMSATTADSYLDGLAKEFFGTDDPLHATYFKNFLVASVARGRYPGIWMDCALILHGEQGVRKSTFWRTLFGDEWFSDDLGGDTDRDEKMKMHRFWCLEWGEFETVYKRKDVEELKRFLARKDETFRTPYDRVSVDYKRGFVFVGTTNQTEILNDPSGDRRFWIIPVSLKKIPVELVQAQRDKIWASANALFKSGYTYRLTDEQEKQRSEKNQDFQVIDPWFEIIDGFVTGKDFVTTQSIYHLLSIEPSRQDISSDKRISGVMRRLGWERGRESGKRGIRGWRRKENAHENNIFQEKVVLGGSGGSATPETLAYQPIQSDPPAESSRWITKNEATPETLAYQPIQSDPPAESSRWINGDKVDHSSDDFSGGFNPPNDPPMIHLEPLQVDHKKVPIINTSSDSDPPDPPRSTFFEKNNNQKVDHEFLSPSVPLPSPIKLVSVKKPVQGAVYWSKSFKAGVRVQKIYSSVKTADIAVPGEITLERVPLSDLMEYEDWKPNVNKQAYYGKDKVTIVGGGNGKWQIEYSFGRFSWVKTADLSPVY